MTTTVTTTTKTLASTVFNLDGWHVFQVLLERFLSDDNDKSDNNNDNKSDNNDNNNKETSKMQYFAAMHDCKFFF